LPSAQSGGCRTAAKGRNPPFLQLHRQCQSRRFFADAVGGCPEIAARDSGAGTARRSAGPPRFGDLPSVGIPEMHDLPDLVARSDYAGIMSLTWRRKALISWGNAGRFDGARGQTGSRPGTLASDYVTEKNRKVFPHLILCSIRAIAQLGTGNFLPLECV